MTTRTTENGIAVLVPADGMRLYNGETVAEGEVYLGANASPDTWHEIAADEAEAILVEDEAEAILAEAEAE